MPESVRQLEMAASQRRDVVGAVRRTAPTEGADGLLCAECGAYVEGFRSCYCAACEAAICGEEA